MSLRSSNIDLHRLIADWHIQSRRTGRRYWSHAAPRISPSMSAWRVSLCRAAALGDGTCHSVAPFEVFRQRAMRPPSHDNRGHHARRVYVFQQPSLPGLRPADRQGGQGPEWRGSHFVWDVGSVPRFACVGDGLCHRKPARLENGFPVSEQRARLRHHPPDCSMEALAAPQAQDRRRSIAPSERDPISAFQKCEQVRFVVREM